MAEKLAILAFLVPVFIAYVILDYREEFIQLIRKHSDSGPKYELLVGVLSAREHFQERQTIRDTWMNAAKSEDNLGRVKVLFVVGNQACPVPHGDRENEFSCNRWNFSLPDKVEEVELFTETERAGINFEKKNYGLQSKSFMVQHPVILTQLGLHADSLGSRVQVKLLAAYRQTEIVSAVFTKENPGTVIQGYRYLPVEPYLLPKGFEGTIILDNLEKASGKVRVTPYDVTINSQGASYVLRLYDMEPEVRGNYADPMLWNSTRIPLVSFIYKIHEIESLNKHVFEVNEREHQHLQLIEKENKKLTKESEKYGDLLFFDAVDVYRALPVKALSFYKWAIERTSFEYLLKTDDDCFINIHGILDKLKSFRGQQKAWWGRFRQNWVVERYGKWAELDYRAELYPPFACGSGSVMSHDLVQWIASNVDHLKSFQGEDVSLGIWLSSVGPSFFDDPLWQCDSECISDMYSVPDLTSAEMTTYWQNQQTCGDPCGCP